MTRSVSKSALSLIALGAVLALLQQTPAAAQNVKSYVSTTGSDASNCATPATACRHLSTAFSNTNPGGEISFVNPGDYGEQPVPVTTFQSVHITNDGIGEVSILAGAGVPAIHVNAGAGEVVSLRGLVIDGAGGGTRGIDIGRASAVHIQNCVIRNFQAPGDAFGVVFEPTFNSQLFISDTVIFNNGSTTATAGAYVIPFHNINANVVLARVHLENNVIGLWVDGSGAGQPTSGSAYVIVRDSVVSGNVSHGIEALSVPGQSPAFIVVEHTSVVNNAGIGILANGPRATMLLNDNTITRNGTGISAVNGGQLISYGNNKNNNNIGPEGAPTGLFSQM